MNYDGECVKHMIIVMIHIFSLVNQCDRNTVHEKPNHGLDAERRVLKELVIKNLTTITKDDIAFQKARELFLV